MDNEQSQPIGSCALLGWLRAKLADAERALRAREQMEKTWRSGTDESWAAAAEFHPSTAGRPMSKAEGIKAANSQQRIAVKCRRDVEMFRALLARIDQPEPDVCESAAKPLVGRRWKAVMNGKKTLNGERHSVTTFGDIKEGEGSIFDVIRELAEHLEEQADMEYPDSAQVTILPPNAELSRGE